MSLPDYNKVTLPAVAGKEVTLEVNFKDDPEAKSLIRVNGSDVIKIKDLYQFLLIVGDPEVQEGLMPVKKTEVFHFTRIHNAVAQKDIKKGEKIRFHCEVSVPTTVVEGLAGIVDKKIEVKPKSSFIVP